jgi:hypothetical protein
MNKTNAIGTIETGRVAVTLDSQVIVGWSESGRRPRWNSRSTIESGAICEPWENL